MIFWVTLHVGQPHAYAPFAHARHWPPMPLARDATVWRAVEWNWWAGRALQLALVARSLWALCPGRPSKCRGMAWGKAVLGAQYTHAQLHAKCAACTIHRSGGSRWFVSALT